MLIISYKFWLMNHDTKFDTYPVVGFCTIFWAIFNFIIDLANFCNIDHVVFDFTLWSVQNTNAGFLKFKHFRLSTIEDDVSWSVSYHMSHVIYGIWHITARSDARPKKNGLDFRHTNLFGLDQSAVCPTLYTRYLKTYHLNPNWNFGCNLLFGPTFGPDFIA